MNARLRWAIILATALVLLAAWYLVVWNGRQADLAAITDHTTTLVQQSNDLRSQVRDATKFKSAGKTSRARLAALRAGYPNDTDISGFIRANDQLATTSGALVESLTPDAVNSRDKSAPLSTKTISISLKVSGTEQAVDGYIGRLQSLTRTTAIDSLDLTAENAGSISASIRLRLFVARNAKLASSS